MLFSDGFETEEVKQAKIFEIEGVHAAEQGDTLQAIDLFGKSINTAPERASGYNNRAQALRLSGDTLG